MTQNNSQKGIATSITITIIVLAIIVAGVAYYFIQQQSVEVMVKEKGEAMMAKEPSVIVSDQTVQDGTVTIDSVVTVNSGWIVIHNSVSGKPGPIVGYATVNEGKNDNVVVRIDAEKATADLFAMLHIDAGVMGTYEFPGNDVPIKSGDEVVVTGFMTTGEAMVDKETETMMMEAGPIEDTMMKKVDDTMMKEMMTMVYQYSGQLADVTESKTIRGISTDGKSSGTAKASFKDDAYSLLATFQDLPESQGTDFYEGWVVRKGLRFSVISTGKIEKVDGVYTNMYLSGEDLTDHDFYVLTIEPDDNNPAPADHILEGTMAK